MNMTTLFQARDLDLILRSLRFAAEKHQFQKRKDERGLPYINHPIQVAETLWSIGRVRDCAVLAGALLHDTVEDTATTLEELSTEFGAAVAELVAQVSDDKTLPKEERKRLQIVHSPHISPGAQQIKLADKICNVHDLLHNAPAGWPTTRKRAYLDWSEAVVAGLRGCNPALEAHYDALLLRGRDSFRI